jgi:coenzyme F420-0:L-glutamate ligase/coenzyme F420-1:gamma-L-glutamate ligase
MQSAGIQIMPLTGIPEIVPGDNIAGAIAQAIKASSIHTIAGDLFVVAHKIISKAEGQTVDLDSVTPSATAQEWASELGKDPQLMELILSESRRVVRKERGVLIVETHQGLICANAGVDVSNCPPGTAVLLPRDPDDSARRLKQSLDAFLGVSIGVIISDTFGRPWREGQVNVAIGLAGFAPLKDYRGHQDVFGRTLQASVLAVADELASAAELVMGKSERIPVAVVRGCDFDSSSGTARELIRRAEQDLFRQGTC